LASVENDQQHLAARGDSATAMLETVRALDAAGLQPTTLALREPTLDDVFLELTGHVAEQQSENGEEAMATGRRRRRRAS
jgi:ABC-2 type transport system ATP-binding protein